MLVSYVDYKHTVNKLRHRDYKDHDPSVVSDPKEVETRDAVCAVTQNMQAGTSLQIFSTLFYLGVRKIY